MGTPGGLVQDKQKEIAFFDACADSAGEYNVFSEESTKKIVQRCAEFGGFRPSMKVVDLGCGSGVFTQVLKDMGYEVSGLDLSRGLIEAAKRRRPTIPFLVGDVENLPLESESLDAVLLSGILHHLPDLTLCAKEVWRVLKPGGVFVAFDPNRLNPFMWLYRDKNSPFYSSQGVTENERPIVASQVAALFRKTGFDVTTGYLSGLQYRYIASPTMRKILPIYNFIDDLLFRPSWLKPCSAFVLTRGRKLSARV